ncbi:PspC domain-containing protein [Candidatus Woesearchaeota archaeon]|nr:PspC domain-containing protein [Candidatus Woesearchaeota archaeon]
MAFEELVLLVPAIVLSVILLVLLITGFWVLAVIACLVNPKLSGSDKLVWLLIIILFCVFGAAAYFIFVRPSTEKKMTKKKSFKGKRLLRSSTDRMIAGVCAGIGDYSGTDPTIIRLIWVLLTFITGIVPGVIVYFAAWIIIPEK